VIDDIELALKGMLKPIYEEVVLGRAEVREIFRSSKAGTIAGSMVSSGIMRRNTQARLLRDGKGVGDNVTVTSLRRFTDDVTEVRPGVECGIGLRKTNDTRQGDMLEHYKMQEKPRAYLAHPRRAIPGRRGPIPQEIYHRRSPPCRTL